MAPPSSRRRNNNLGFWLPLAATAAVITAGFVAWIWNESEKDDEDELGNDSGYRALRSHSQHRQQQGSGYNSEEVASQSQWDNDTEATLRPTGHRRKSLRSQDQDKKNEYPDAPEDSLTSSYFSSPVSRRRTGESTYAEPSTSSLSAAREKLSAFGSALGLFNEPDAIDKDFYRRRPEARNVPTSATDEMAGERPPVMIRRKRTVAIVVSSEDTMRSIDGHYSSLLSTLSRDIDATFANIYTLIYTPGLRLAKKDAIVLEKPQSESSGEVPETEEGAIATATDEGTVRESKGKRPQRPTVLTQRGQGQGAPQQAVASNISSLVARYENPSESVITQFKEASCLTILPQIFPFSTEKGHVHLLCNLKPEVVYIQECLTGAGGDGLKAFSGWVGSCVVIPDGSAEMDGGFGRVRHTDDDADDANGDGYEYGRRGKGREKYYREAGFAGRGRKVDIVESAFLGEDWRDRVVIPMM